MFYRLVACSTDRQMDYLKGICCLLKAYVRHTGKHMYLCLGEACKVSYQQE